MLRTANAQESKTITKSRGISVGELLLPKGKRLSRIIQRCEKKEMRYFSKC